MAVGLNQMDHLHIIHSVKVKGANRGGGITSHNAYS